MFTGYVQSCESSLIGEALTTQPHARFSGINRSRRDAPMLLENASSPFSAAVNSVVLQLAPWAYAVAESAIKHASRQGTLNVTFMCRIISDDNKPFRTLTQFALVSRDYLQVGDLSFGNELSSVGLAHCPDVIIRIVWCMAISRQVCVAKVVEVNKTDLLCKRSVRAKHHG